MAKKTNTIHYTICGLEYIYLVDPPIGIESGEEYIDIPPKQIDALIARAIISQSIPIRGKEVMFLRKALGMNRNQWAEKLAMTASGILRWERASHKRLSRINEVAIRMICAEELGIKLDGKWSAVVCDSKVPDRLEIAS